MEIRKSIFGSKSEMGVYNSLNTVWGKEFKFWHEAQELANKIGFKLPHLTLQNNLKLVNILYEPNMDILDSSERNFFLKTEVDFTFCEDEDYVPILSIEFDGMSKGLNRDGKYLAETTADAQRKKKLDLKHKLAEMAGYPII